MSTPHLDQYLIDYCVRNITTGDEEEVRLLEMTDEEAAGLPASVQAVLNPLRHEYQADNVIQHPVWDAAQDEILALLLPYISDRPLYDTDYGQWERNLLGDEGDEGDDDDTSVSDTWAAIRPRLCADCLATLDTLEPPTLPAPAGHPTGCPLCGAATA